MDGAAPTRTAPLATPPQPAHFQHGRIKIGNDPTRARDQFRARGGEGDRTHGAVEEGNATIGFQLPDRLGQGRGHHMQEFRRTGE